MEQIGGELDEKWVEKEESKKLSFYCGYVYSVDWPVVQSTGDTENQEIQVSIKTLWNLQE